MGDRSQRGAKAIARRLRRVEALEQTVHLPNSNKCHRNQQASLKPHVVSFGPYHHGLEYLQAMEEHKRRALLHFLRRSKEPLQSFVDALVPVVDDLRDAYEKLDPKWGDVDKFVEMMIVDGCFMLEILGSTSRAPLTPPPPLQTDDSTRLKDYADNDPIFSKHGMLYTVPHLKRDMLMLENQLLMLLLHNLVSTPKDKTFKYQLLSGCTVHLVHTRVDGEDLTKHILKFFTQNVPTKHIHHFHNCPHILDLYVDKPKHKRRSGHQGGDEIIRSATELGEAGIRIRKSHTRSLIDISFNHGVLRLPLVVVDDALYLNLIAFERFHVGAGNQVTSYIFFMNNLINSAQDVGLLHSWGIIQNAYGSDEAVANLFNSLTKDISLDPDSELNEVGKLVSAYCQTPWILWRAKMKHVYFSDPLATLSIIAFVFNALTIVQTIYSVLAYVNR